jgi:hypothetical protein
MPVKPIPFEIGARRPVWDALSDLFLDTDTSLSRSWRVRTLAESPYTIEELEAILVDEIYPVCRSNLMSIAGEWSGFDPEWLERKIMKRLNSPFRAMHVVNLGRLTVKLSSEWRATKREFNATRAAATHSAA